MSHSGKKSDYFGSFLGTLSDLGVSAAASAPGQPELLDRIITACLGGPRALGDLLAPGDSIASLLGAIQTLQTIGYMTRRDGDIFELTPKGHDAAAKMAQPPRAAV
jgi:hypothetical protein